MITKFSQPAFDGEFGVLLAAIAVLITVSIYAVAHCRAKARWKALAKEIAEFNQRTPEAKKLHALMKDYYIECKDLFQAPCIDLHVRATRPLDDCSVKSNVYGEGAPAPGRFERCEKLYLEILILDSRGVAIVNSKIFVFYYINSSWHQSLDFFFRFYRVRLMYYWLCDSWYQNQ